MPSTNDTWRKSLGSALDKATPVGARLVQSLEGLAGGASEPIAAMAGGPGGVASDISSQLHGWTRGIDQSIRRPAQAGTVMMVVFVFGLGLWATTAPLTSAVVSHGTFVATGQNKIVSHLEGGIISKILVNEGDEVQAGQPLMEMDDTTTRSEEQRIEIKGAMLLATKARIEAQRDGLPDVAFPEELTKLMGNPEVAKTVQAQRSLFASRTAEFESQREINERQIGAIEQEIEGLKSQKLSTETQLDLMTAQLETSQRLLEKGLTERSRVSDQQRTRAKLEGDIGQFVSEIGKAEQHILETKTNLTHLRSKMFLDDADVYRQTTAELSDNEQRLTAARGVLDRHILRAPVHGLIVKLQYHTAGGVLPPSQPVLEILPTDEKLIVEAQVRPEEIDFIHVGQQASVRLTALNQRTTPLVLGNVTYVSADKITNPNARVAGAESYYLARIELDEASIKERVGKVKISPGMPAEVYMKTGERTMFQYLARPIIDVMYKGGREK